LGLRVDCGLRQLADSDCGEREAQMREYGYAAVEDSGKAATEIGVRVNRPLFWLERYLSGGWQP
jgi:hypothetical protein